MSAVPVLLLDDDPGFLASLEDWVSGEGYEPVCATSKAQGLQRLAHRDFFAALVDIRMPGGDGLEILAELKQVAPRIEVVMLTGDSGVDTAVAAMRAGAYDYLTKPLDEQRLGATLAKAVEKSRLARRAHALEEEVSRLQDALKQRFGVGELIGRSAAMQPVYDRVMAAARTRGTVLITGESGTGKELVARAIHHEGDGLRPFLAVNCAALPQELIESELFGHRRGAFTSAVSDSPGLFAAARNGTLFLDEITEMAPGTQAKLLRVLQERTVRAVGSHQETPLEVRVIASTNRDPRAAVAGGQLREDLFYRLSVINVKLPPLRERPEDIPLLAAHLVQRLASRVARDVDGIERDALEALCRYPWPGNVRELENALEQALTLGRSVRITLADLPTEITVPDPGGRDILPEQGVVSLKDAERLAIVRALAMLKGNKVEAARALGISRKQLYVKLAAMGRGYA